MTVLRRCQSFAVPAIQDVLFPAAMMGGELGSEAAHQKEGREPQPEPEKRGRNKLREVEVSARYRGRSK